MNAQVFVEYKSAEKAALVVNMIEFNHNCMHRAWPFKLPSLEGLASTLHSFLGEAWACKFDLKDCHLSVHLPPDVVNTLKLAGYVVVYVPFGWHQALGLVQHLIGHVLETLDRESIIIIQYLDDILLVGKYHPVLSAAAAP